MKDLKRRVMISGLLGIGLAGAFYAGVAYAADQRLDEADSAIQQAIILLKAAKNEGRTPPFGGHREAAIKDLEHARAQIKKAKQFADNPPPKPGKHGDNDNDGKGKGKDKHHGHD